MIVVGLMTVATSDALLDNADMRILGISGSLRASSTNTRLLRAAAALMPAEIDFHLTAKIASLTAFSPDLDPDDFPAARAWVDEMRESDGIIVSTPEYARGYPGALKNALDWLVPTDAFVAKPFMLLNATSRSTVAQDTLTTVLETMSGVHIVAASTTVPLLGTKLDVVDILDKREFIAQIGRSLRAFVAAIESRS